MFEKFQDYMYYLLFEPLKKVFKRDNQFYILFKVFGKLFDQTKKDIFRAREESMVISASEKMLPEHGKDRDIPRLRGEDIENYRTRLSMKNIIAEKSGTVEGILLAISSLGYKNVYHRPTYLYDPKRWAEFDIVFDELKLDRMYNFDIVRSVVRDVKQASSLPNYGFNIKFKNIENINIASTHRATINFFGNISLYLDGTWTLNGTNLLCGLENLTDLHQTKVTNRLSINTSESFDNSRIRIEQNLWFLDGSYMLDGTKIMNAKIIEEEI